jgi:hypothetical protein
MPDEGHNAAQAIVYIALCSKHACLAGSLVRKECSTQKRIDSSARLPGHRRSCDDTDLK